MFGWCVTGLIFPRPVCPNHPLSVFATTRQYKFDTLDLEVKEFLHADVFEVKPDAPPPISPEERRALDILENNVRHVGDRYEAGFIWKEGHTNLPNNYTTAFTRLLSTERSLLKNPKLMADYTAGIENSLSSGFCDKLSDEAAA